MENIDKIHKLTENTGVALHPEVFSGIDFQKERVCQLFTRFVPGYEAKIG
uniref:Uncharacterized protein n=1 Tax=Oryza sativa subsp. japonica TaxID=39947 RepID=Q2QTQ4_ORYSJ|nr:hypothetical protein LOC_Os12g18870 [Oryza sativa Japonica Group]